MARLISKSGNVIRQSPVIPASRVAAALKARAKSGHHMEDRRPSNVKRVKEDLSSPNTFWIHADGPGHVFERIAQKIIHYLSDQFELKMDYTRSNVVHSRGAALWWGRRDLFKNQKGSAVCIYDNRLWGKEMLEGLAQSFGCICVSSEELIKRVVANSVVQSMNIPIFPIQDGVDTKVFKPSKNRSRRGKLQIGWAGVRRKDKVNPDPKGYLILKKAAAATKDIADWYFIDKHTNPLPHTQMPGFYQGLDIVVCASIQEGTPNPILEGAACGCLPITTRVGVTPELEADGLSIKFVDRDEGAFIKAVKQVYKDRTELKQAILDNPRIMHEKWDWSVKIKNWERIFKYLSGSESAANGYRPSEFNKLPSLTLVESTPIVEETPRGEGKVFDTLAKRSKSKVKIQETPKRSVIDVAEATLPTPSLVSGTALVNLYNSWMCILQELVPNFLHDENLEHFKVLAEVMTDLINQGVPVETGTDAITTFNEGLVKGDNL